MSELRIWRVAAGLCALCALLFSRAGHADVCIPYITGVPGMWGEAPRWSGTPPPQVRAVIDDPRWLGAMRQSFPQQMAVQGQIRGLNDASYLYLSLSTLVRPGDPATNLDSVYLGFNQGAAAEAKLIKLTLTTNSTMPSGTGTGLNASFFTKAAGAATTWMSVLPPAMPWIEAAHLWADTTNDTWTVNVKVNLANLGVTAPFRSFFAVHAQLTTFPPPGTAVQYVYPTGGATGPFSETNLAPVDPSLWQNTTLGTSAAPCADGITLSYNQIGTTNADPTFVDTDDPNVFRVTPDWGPVAPVAGLIQARFRLAHWGSIAAPDAAWTVFASNVQNGGGAVPAGVIEYRCGGASEPACPTLAVGEDPHQCMMVELSGTGTLPVHFARDSAWNNMRFGTASTFMSPARISLAGIPPIGATPREVYIYVKSTNMPAEAVGKEREGLPKGSMLREQAAARAYRYPRVSDFSPPIPVRPPGAAAGGVGQGGQGGLGGSGGLGGQGAQGGANPGPLPVESDKDLMAQMRETRPTYEVHTYYDTGLVSSQGTSQFRLFRPLIPFGYFVYHEEPLAGWLTRIQAEGGYVLDEIAPNLYRARIPEGGSMTVKTTIIARGPNDPVPPIEHGRCNCDVVRPRTGGLLEFGAAFALAAVFAARVLRSRRRSR
jgi:hypothetical protein